MNARKCLSVTLLAVASLAMSVSNASAIPILQLYVEGATYVGGPEESWVYTGSGPIRVWTIGNVAGQGGKGTIEDVRLAIAYAAGATPTFTLAPSTTGGYAGYDDPSIAGAATFRQLNTSGAVPLLGDGSPLPQHGAYGPGTWWQEFDLGDFTLTDSPMADFISSVPVAPSTANGQINVYQVSVAGVTDPITLHFDLYNHVQAGNKVKYKFAPFSHDAEGCCTTVPEPGTISMLGSALAALAGAFTVRRRMGR